MSGPTMVRKPTYSTESRCDWRGPNHLAIIPKGKPVFVVQTGKAQGRYHNIHCYNAALKHYEELEKKVGIVKE